MGIRDKEEISYLVSRTLLDKTWDILNSGVDNISKLPPDCPLEFPGTSRDIVKAASIDAIFNFSMHNSGYFSLQTSGVSIYKDYQDPFVPSLEGSPFTFVCHGKLEDCEFMIEYLQWRRPYCVGYWYPPDEQTKEVENTPIFQKLFSAPARCYADGKRRNTSAPDFIYYTHLKEYTQEKVSPRGTVIIRLSPTDTTPEEIILINDIVKSYEKYWIYSPITEHCTISQGIVRPMGYCYLIMQNPTLSYKRSTPIYSTNISKEDLLEESIYTHRKAISQDIPPAIWAGIIPYWALGPMRGRFL